MPQTSNSWETGGVARSPLRCCIYQSPINLNQKSYSKSTPGIIDEGLLLLRFMIQNGIPEEQNAVISYYPIQILQ